MTSPCDQPGLSRKAQTFIAALFLTQFFVVCAVKITKGIAPEILWTSHVSLLLATIGIAIRNPLLITTAFASICVLHFLWLVDFVAGFTTGTFPLAATVYLEQADLQTWLATLHHFYLAPILVWVIFKTRRCPIEAIPLACAVFVFITAICHAATPPHLNVNYTYGINNPFEQAWIMQLNRLPKQYYLLLLNGFVAGVCNTPPVLAMRAAMKTRTDLVPTPAI